MKTPRSSTPLRADVRVDLVGERLPLLGVLGLVVHPGQPGAAVQRHPAHQLARREVLRLAADLPDAAVRLLPVRAALSTCRLAPATATRAAARATGRAGRPSPAPRPRRRAAAGCRRRCRPAPGRRPRSRTGAAASPRQLALAAHAVHHLQVARRPGTVGDEVEEVVGLAVETERVQPPQGERRVADPGVAVVPVALAAAASRAATSWPPPAARRSGRTSAPSGSARCAAGSCARGGPGSRRG